MSSPVRELTVQLLTTYALRGCIQWSWWPFSFRNDLQLLLVWYLGMQLASLVSALTLKLMMMLPGQ